MNLKIEIRRNQDGVVAADVWNGQEWTEASDFLWSDGNYSCDCNREHFFLRAMGQDEDDDSATACGDERFSARISNADTGDVLYDEFSESDKSDQA